MRFADIAQPTYDGEGGSGGGAPAAPSGGEPSAPAPSAPSGGTPAAPAAQPKAPEGFTYKEDRSTWQPPHVNRKTIEQRDRLAQELEFERRRVAALTGVKLEQPRNPEHEQIRAQLREVFPELAELMDQKDKLAEIAGMDFSRITSAGDAVWTRHGASTLQAFEDTARESLGDLKPAAMKILVGTFVNAVANDPELARRYEAGDPRIIGEFIKDYQENFLDPYASRKASAAVPGVMAARNLPRGGGGSARSSAKPAALKPSDPKFHESAFASFQANR